MTMSDRGIHPDLLDEALAARDETATEPPSPEAAPSRGRGRRAQRAPVSDSTPTAPDSESVPSVDDSRAADGAEATTEPPEWLAQLDDAKDPVEKFKLLSKNLPRDVLEKDPTLQGWLAGAADFRARELLKKQERDSIEQAKLEAARNNDLYTLGEMTQRDYQAAIAQQQAAQQAGPFMDGVVKFQQSLDQSIQEKVGGRTFGEGKGQAEGVAEYLQFITEQAVQHGVERELQRRESAMRKSVMSEINGDEPVPERESGTPGRVREVTDEQIEAMSMSEYNALFDKNGHPNPGVRHRSTRGIPLRPQ